MPRRPATPKPAIGTFGIDLAAMDHSVKPRRRLLPLRQRHMGLTTFEMPPDKARYGVFDALRDKSEVDVRTLLERAAAATPRAAGSVQQKVADLYGRWMDGAAIEARGVAPLEADLDGSPPPEPRPTSSRSWATWTTRADRRVYLARSGRHDALRRHGRSGRARHARPRLLLEPGRTFDAIAPRTKPTSRGSSS